VRHCALLAVVLFAMPGCDAFRSPGWLNAHREAAEDRWQTARSGVRLSLAEDQLRNGRFDDAEAELARVALDDPECPGLRLSQVRLAVARGQFAQAEPLLWDIVETEPPNAEAYYLLGAALQHAGQLEQAVSSYSTAAALDPKSHEYHFAVAECFLSAGEPESALRWLDEQSDVPGLLESPDYHRLRGQVYRLLDEQARAAQAYEMAVLLGAEDPYTRKDLAFAYLSQGDYAAALELLEPLIDEAEEPSPALLMAAARCYIETGRARQARAVLGALVRNHDDPWAWMLLAQASARCGDPAAAIKNAEQAVAMSPDSPAAIQLLAGLAVQADDLPRALRAAEDAITLAPTDPLNYCLLADVCRRLGNTERAIRLYNDALHFDPDNDTAQTALLRLGAHAAAQ
jgi:tetratricopeptide (TPR) repeat protein